jgi:preprotein translocase subunit SecA
VLKYIPDYVAETLSAAVNVEDMPELWNEAELNAALEAKLLPEGTNYVTRERLMKWDYETALRKISNKVAKEYEKKIEDLKELGIDFSAVERRVLLMTVDRNWIDHIDAMDQLRKGISLRAYGQVDPVISYKKEGYDMFDEMVARIQRTTISTLLKVRVEARPAPVQRVNGAPMAQTNGANAQAAAPAAPAKPATPAASRPFRRQMPEPITNMKSFQQAMAAAQAARAAQGDEPKQDDAEEKKTDNE